MKDLILSALSKFGKGPGFMAFAFVELGVAALLLRAGVGGTDIGLALGPINVALYGGGAWKAAAEARNGGGT